MVDAAQVRLFGRTVGFVSWNSRYGAARFEYDSDFVRSGLTVHNNIRNASQIIDEICEACSGSGRIAHECSKSSRVGYQM